MNVYHLYGALFAGIIAAYFAEKRGRRPAVWGLLGCAFGLFILVVLFARKSLKVPNATA